MKGHNWSLLVLVAVLCHFALAAPSQRVKREEEFKELSLDPIEVEVI